MSSLVARKAGPLTRQEIEDAAAILNALLPLSPQRRLTALAIVCRALWDDRLDDLDRERKANG